MERIEVNLVFHKVSEELPQKSGEYIVVTASGTVGSIPYSAKHRRFNFFDSFDPQKTEYQDIYPAVFWAETPSKFLYENMQQYKSEV